MLARLFPRRIDNAYDGRVVAVWLLALLALVKLVQGANVAGLNPWVSSRRVLETADRVPVGAFPAEAAAHLVFLFASWGLGIFLLGLLAVVVLVRYRAMIPLMYLLLLVEQLGRKVLTTIHLQRPFLSPSLSAASLINWAFLAAIVVGLSLSVSRRRASA